MLHGVPTGETIERLTAIPGRGAGTDAERRAALWLERDLRERGHARVDGHVLGPARVGVAGGAGGAARRGRERRLRRVAARRADRRRARRGVPGARGRRA